MLFPKLSDEFLQFRIGLNVFKIFPFEIFRTEPGCKYPTHISLRIAVALCLHTDILCFYTYTCCHTTALEIEHLAVGEILRLNEHIPFTDTGSGFIRPTAGQY